MSMNQHSRIRNALVTGGTDGIGKEIARGLARAGHRLILVGRDAEKGARATQEILRTAGNQGVRLIPADLSLVSEAHRLAGEVALHFPLLHYIVHSAGVVRGRQELTREGVESNFAINFLGRFALTQNLLPLLRATGQPDHSARIVIISGAARNGKIHFDDVNLTKNFAMLRAVLQFCQVNDVFTTELSRRLASEGNNRPVTVTCLKIGVVKTNIRREFPRWMRWLVPLVLDPVLRQTPQEAAEPALRLLLSDEFEGVTGALFLKIRKFKSIALDADVKDPQVGQRLWELSERLTSRGADSAKRSVSAVTALAEVRR
jgi:NAD(P)-dependent dehydrogenase (short-subunit alcohol dehydrogenase family)